jgi:phosphatidylserine decarboxylase
MSQTIQEWLKSPEIRKLKGASLDYLYSTAFSRDPLRSIYLDPTVYYAPADGIVLYAKTNVQPTDALVEIKGRKFTPRDALDDKDYNYPSLVVGIFMTQYSVHVNRMPTAGYCSEVHVTPYLFTPNISMLFEEQDIMEGKPKTQDMTYLFQNERCVTRVYCPEIRGNYYIVQVAEKDVDEIANWNREHGEYFYQGERFGLIRSGSQVDVIIPLTDKCNFQILAEEKTVVEAGVDAIVKIL